MIRDAQYVMGYIIDPQGLAKPAQVGVDITLNRVSRIISDNKGIGGRIYNDATAERMGMKARFATYDEVATVASDEYEGQTADVFVLEPGVYSIEFDQGLDNLFSIDTAFIVQRSTIGRNGTMIRSSVYDPGFGTPAMGAIMYVWQPIRIERHARVAQIVIQQSYPADVYDGTYQGANDFS